MLSAELFTGCGGLALGFERAGFRHSFFCESDESCREILRHRFPGVPIVEDVRDVDSSAPNADRGLDWNGLQELPTPQRSQAGREGDGPSTRRGELDLLAGGFPCQPFSAAGKRKGEQDDRYLWPEFARAVRVLRPRAVLLENVPGILSMALDSGEPVFGRVMADLAEAGYDAEWFCLRASELGAPHRRERVFVVAHAIERGQFAQQRIEGADLGLSGSRGDDCDAPDSQSNTRRIGDGDGGVAADAEREGSQGPQPARRRHLPAGSGEPPADAADTELEVREGHEIVEGRGPEQSSGPRADSSVAWGIYEPAIRRWESRTRPAPRPTDDRGRLDPRFPEWMLGFPEGWVEGVSRTAQLRMLGNAVQVQVAEVVGAAVYRSLLERKAA